MRAPSTSANLGAGFDVVAVAHDAYVAEAYVKVGSGCGVDVKFRGFDPGGDNTVVRAFRRFFELTGVCRGVEVEVVNHIPVARGLGSSGASAVAALAGFIRETGMRVDPRLVVEAAGFGEAAAAGSPHFDNVAGAALGGAVVLTSLSPVDFVKFTPRLTFVVGVPDVPPMPNKTKMMREVLPRAVEFRTYVRQISRVASLVAGFALSDPRLVARGMEDEVVEAARAPLVPGYHRARRYALEAGALGFALSGAGPSVITLVLDRDADAVKSAVARAYAEEGLRAEVKVAAVAEGALSQT
ncbi:homoserine kinase [Pyrobaculum sp. 3827-6]|uniref:homoserine kinase n=1 Tax=Pyrobaculum sp. 3827-6 TaxID=2983604 RepID=UPI0021D8145F|nr:homoserine kinase [Pyrobaculum sp. 3827-6]MCU7786818.1 homoserine kinase [Pyrobaculum sp. 3827-6]